MKPCKNSKYFEFKNKNFINQITESCFNETSDESRTTCDVIIKCGPEKTEYFCHRIILANASEFLHQMLSTTIPGTIPVLLLPDIKPESIKYILNYVYNGSVEVPLAEYADIHEACLMLGLKGIDEEDKSESNEETEPDMVEIIKNEPIEVAHNDEPMTTEDESHLAPHHQLTEWKEEDFGTEESSMEPTPIQEIIQNVFNFQPNMPSNSFGMPNSTASMRNLDSEPKKERNLIDFTPDIRQDCLERAKLCVRSVYDKLDEKMEDLDAVVNETKLVAFGNKLLRAEHQCAFCESKLAIVYQPHPTYGTKWNNGSFVRHLRRIHKDIKINNLLKGPSTSYVRKNFKNEEHWTYDGSEGFV